MSFSTDWSIDSYKDDHESDEQWDLRRSFMQKWKIKYPEDRLVCLARVFTNIEFMGCRYPKEVMLEVEKMSEEVAKAHREHKKTKLQRTFVSASDAAEDRAKKVKRISGVISEDQNTPTKISKVAFVSSTIEADSEDVEEEEIQTNEYETRNDSDLIQKTNEEKIFDDGAKFPYLKALIERNHHNLSDFSESMFNTKYGRLVLIARQWVNPITNLSVSCQACHIPCKMDYYGGTYFSIVINGIEVSRVDGAKTEAKPAAAEEAWEKLSRECITVLGKKAFVAQNSSAITTDDVVQIDKSRITESDFGTPVNCDVASKMMKMMGWSGGALGASAGGISEPIMPHLQQVRRQGLGSTDQSGQTDIRDRARKLMRKYANDYEIFDVDLVFAADFTKEERALLHTVAKQCGLQSKSYGKNDERFLVVKKRLDPFNLVRGLVNKGGYTDKYEVFIPHKSQQRTFIRK